jgi:hypothetical protein
VDRRVTLVVGALLLTDRLLWQPGLSAENVKCLRPGMTLAEIQALLGGPAADSFEMPVGPRSPESVGHHPEHVSNALAQRPLPAG